MRYFFGDEQRKSCIIGIASPDGEIDEALFKKSKKSLERNTKIGLDGQNWQLGQALRSVLFPEYTNFDRAAAIKRATSHQLVDFVKNLFFNESYILK